MKRFIIAQSGKEFYTSHSGLALMGLCVNKLCSLPAKAREAFPVSAGNNGIGLDDILRSYIGLLATGQSDYEAVSNRREDEYFREALESAQSLRPKRCANAWTRWPRPCGPWSIPARWSS